MKTDSSSSLHIDSNFEQFLHELTQYPLLSREEEIDLATRIAGGDETAKERFILSNMRLVVSIAKHYTNPAVPLQDLVQEGVFGLMIAVERWNPQAGFRFSTYATWWIRQRISRHMPKLERAIQLPVHAVEDLRQICKVPGYLDMSPAQLAGRVKKPVEYVECLLWYDHPMISLDVPREGESLSLAGYLAESVDIEAEALHSTVREPVQAAICRLENAREADVIRRRYGFAPYAHAQTLEEIGLAWNVTKERVRQIEVKALIHLRPFLQSLVEEAV